MTAHESLPNYTKAQDLHPAFSIMKGDLSSVKEYTDISQAVTYLTKIRADIHSSFRSSFMREKVEIHEGARKFFNAQTQQDFVVGLATLLVDAGFSKGNVKEYLIDSNLHVGTRGMDPDAVKGWLETILRDTN